MNATIVSYLAGMSGDFISYLIHKNPNYYPINQIKQTTHNMWMFPNFLEPIGSEAKIYPGSKAWPINKESMNTLNRIYGDYNILLPTHWYNKITPESTNGLFTRGVRLYAREEKTLRLSYALWWIKSHVIANEPWELRKQEMEEMIERNHPRAHLIKEMLINDQYHNWKFLAIKNNMLKNGELDLITYITKHFNLYYKIKNKILTPLENYLYLPIDNLLYNTDSISDLENFLSASIDRNAIALYTEENIKVLENNLNIKIDSLDFLGNNFYSVIKEYAEYFVKQKIKFNDYYDGVVQKENT